MITGIGSLAWVTMRYGRRFFARQSVPSTHSAEVVVPTLIDLLGAAPRSVLDVGCGIGAWLSVWKGAGAEVTGVDGNYVDQEQLMIQPSEFHAKDLAAPFDLGRRFDLVESVEVAEHIPVSSAAGFVDSLVRHGDTVLFSAALPGQSGRGHVNEQPPSYWVTLFEKHGFGVFDVIRWRLWDDPRVSPDYRQNLLLFATGEAADRLRAVTVERSIDVVHPAMLNSFSVRRAVTTAADRIRR